MYSTIMNDKIKLLEELHAKKLAVMFSVNVDTAEQVASVDEEIEDFIEQHDHEVQIWRAQKKLLSHKITEVAEQPAAPEQKKLVECLLKLTMNYNTHLENLVWQENQEVLLDKKTIISDLLQILRDAKFTTQEKEKHFYAKLTPENIATLCKHRDYMAIQFISAVKNIVLMIPNIMRFGLTNGLCFWRSRGEHFVKSLPENKLKNEAIR